jgi:hypothetical protein
MWFKNNEITTSIQRKDRLIEWFYEKLIKLKVFPLKKT